VILEVPLARAMKKGRSLLKVAQALEKDCASVGVGFCMLHKSKP